MPQVINLMLAVSVPVVGAAPRFLTYENADNAHERWNTTGVVFLGDKSSAAACQSACVQELGDDPTSGCTAFTYYHEGHYQSNVRRQCYGEATGKWAPFYSTLVKPDEWGNVTSGQNSPADFVTPCSNRAECSYNGHCRSGVCECYPQWMGKYCGQLNFIPTPRKAGLESEDGGGRVSSWGGSVVRDDNGLYHMFASEMTHNTGSAYSSIRPPCPLHAHAHDLSQSPSHAPACVLRVHTHSRRVVV